MILDEVHSRGSQSSSRTTAWLAQADLSGANFETFSKLPAKLAKLPLAHEPGEDWTCGLSHDVPGYLIEVVSGGTLDKFLRDRIFLPLDMKDTAFLIPGPKRDRLATVYSTASVPGGPLTALPRNFGSPTYFSGGALFSTARDYTRFSRMLLNGSELDGKRLITQDTLTVTTSNQIGDRKVFGFMKYGLGLNVRSTISLIDCVPVRYSHSVIRLFGFRGAVSVRGYHEQH